MNAKVKVFRWVTFADLLILFHSGLGIVNGQPVPDIIINGWIDHSKFSNSLLFWGQNVTILGASMNEHPANTINKQFRLFCCQRWVTDLILPSTIWWHYSWFNSSFGTLVSFEFWDPLMHSRSLSLTYKG